MLMSWLRVLLIAAPVVAIGATLWFVGEVRGLDYRADQDLILGVREDPGPLNPFSPANTEGEIISSLIYDRLLVRDEQLRLRPHLLESWEMVTQVRFFFQTDEDAKKGAEAVETAKESWAEWGLLEAVRDQLEIRLLLEGHQVKVSESLAGLFPEEALYPVTHLQIRTSGAAAESFRDFTAHAVEAEQIQRAWMTNNHLVELAIAGEPERFLKEAGLYYRTNDQLDAQIETKESARFLEDPILLLRLRQDVAWHDGAKFTTDDVVFSFQMATGETSGWQFKSRFDYVQNVEKVDAFTLRVILRKPYAPALETWEKLPVLPAHLLRGKPPGPFFSAPVGTGPFRFAGKEGRSIMLDRNDDYFLGAPRQERTVFRLLRNPLDRAVAMRTAVIDGFRPTVGEVTRLSGDPRFELVQDVARLESFVAWNLRNPFLKDERVRRALAHAVDENRLVAETMGPDAVPWSGLFYPGSWFARGKAGLPAFDPDKTAELLEAAGWTRYFNGWHNAEDEILELTLLVERSNEAHRRLALALAREWAEAGIVVQVEAHSWEDMVGARVMTGEFDGALLSWRMDPGLDQFSVWHSSKVAPGQGNFTGLQDEAVDEVLEHLRTAFDSGRTQELAIRLQDLIVARQPCLFLCAQGDFWVFRKGATGEVRPVPVGDGNLVEWERQPLEARGVGLMRSMPWWVRGEAIDSEGSNP